MTNDEIAEALPERLSAPRVMYCLHKTARFLRDNPDIKKWVKDHDTVSENKLRDMMSRGTETGPTAAHKTKAWERIIGTEPKCIKQAGQEREIDIAQALMAVLFPDAPNYFKKHENRERLATAIRGYITRLRSEEIR